MIWLSLAFIYAGLVACAMGMEAHHRVVFMKGAASLRGRRAMWLGAALLAIALGVAVASAGFGTGLVEWFTGLAGCGFALTLCLAIRPGWWPSPLALLLIAALASGG